MSDYHNTDGPGANGPKQGMSPTTKTALKWGVIGAIVAIPVPFVGPFLGAAVGGGLGWAKAKGKI